MLAETAAALGLAAVDLRPVLAPAGRCLYHPRNMHEQANGNTAAAERAQGARARLPH